MIKPNRIPLNKLLLKSKAKKTQNFLFSPQALERSESKINMSLLFQENTDLVRTANTALTIQDDLIQNITANDERINGLKHYIQSGSKDLLSLKPKGEWNRSDIERDTAVDDLVFSDKNSIFSESDLSGDKLTSSSQIQNKLRDIPSDNVVRCGTKQYQCA